MYRIMAAVVVLAATALTPAAARADGSLGEAVGDLARDVKSYLDGVGKNRVTIGQFPGRGDLARHSSAGPLLQTALETALRRLKVEVVDRKGDFELSGEFTEMEDAGTGRQFVLIKLELRDRVGNVQRVEGIKKTDGREQVTEDYVKKEGDLARLV